MRLALTLTSVAILRAQDFTDIHVEKVVDGMKFA
jgi:hypothetical protein